MYVCMYVFEEGGRSRRKLYIQTLYMFQYFSLLDLINKHSNKQINLTNDDIEQ